MRNSKRTGWKDVFVAIALFMVIFVHQIALFATITAPISRIAVGVPLVIFNLFFLRYIWSGIRQVMTRS